MKILKTSAITLAVFTLLLGIAYPLSITGFANLFFSDQATGSLVVMDGKVVGSRLVGQDYQGDAFFQGRPSLSGYRHGTASNIALSNPKMREMVALAKARLGRNDARKPDIPSEMLLESASGLDPDISVASAMFQAETVARARSIDAQKVKELIDSMAKPGIGYRYVNVLELNMKILEMKP